MVVIPMVQIPAGTFTMGSEKSNDEKPPHTVYIRSFLMGKTEVTQRQWQEVMGSNPSRFTVCGLDCPVENVSWNDAQEFIAKLSSKAGQKYRLPSEAEWEYAARAGTNTEWSFGNDAIRLAEHGWYDQNSLGTTHAVATKNPNWFGLFDMHGNVWEWVEDCWHGTYASAPADGSAWAAGCSGNFRVLRGGAHNQVPALSRSANRYSNYPDNRYISSGFRIARSL